MSPSSSGQPGRVLLLPRSSVPYRTSLIVAVERSSCLDRCLELRPSAPHGVAHGFADSKDASRECERCVYWRSTIAHAGSRTQRTLTDAVYITVTLMYAVNMKYLENTGLTPEAAAAPDARAAQALIYVLPRTAQSQIIASDGNFSFELGGQQVKVFWIGEGRLRNIHELLSRHPLPAIVAGRHLSPGAKKLLSDSGIGWVDETGAAEIAVGPVIVCRPGRPSHPKRLDRWSPSAVCVAEVLLCGNGATVAGTSAETGLSFGSCAHALRFLTDLGLLEADAARGRGSGRRVADRDRLLDAYAQAAHEASERQISITIGVAWQDVVAGVIEVGRSWDEGGISWAATGAVAAAAMAPLLTDIGHAEVYVDVNTAAGLESAAAAAGLRPMPAGRLTLRRFPTRCTGRLARMYDGLRTAPWPRVYADLRRVGVRGEEAAEHLRNTTDAT